MHYTHPLQSEAFMKAVLCSLALVVAVAAGAQPAGPPPVPAAPSNLTAVGASATSIRLTWSDNANNESSYRIERKVDGNFVQLGFAAIDATSVTIQDLTPGEAVTFRIRAANAGGFSGYSNEATGVTNALPSTCTPTSTVVCLLNNRFKVSVDYVNPFSTPPNQPGTFLAARLLQGVQNPDTALFGFSSAQAVEVVVRIQDTRPFAQRFDVYFGGMTDVAYTVSVTDTTTGATRQYTNLTGQVGGGVDRASYSTN
jgi:hypothetical protein